MKLTAIVILTTALHVCAAGYSQTVTLSKKNARIEKVFTEIREQTGYNFLYNDDWLRQTKPVTIFVKNAPLKQVLDICFNDQPFTYSIIEKTIVIKQGSRTDISAPPPVTVRGKVTDSEGNPLAGVSVSVKGGRTSGVTTNESGNFTIEVDENATLEISYVGFLSQSIKITKDRTEVSLSLQKAANDLGEVVVVGYGRDTRKKLVSAVSTIKTENVVTLPYSNMADALAGRAPGIITQNSGGEPGLGGARVAIRGGADPSRGEPLYVIDNVVSSKYDFQNLQPQDIESISILKDGSATAVYGSRSANGIILVTTRRGQKGKVNINFNTLYELSTPIVLPKRINAYNYALAQNLAAKADGAATLPFRETLLDTLLHHKDPVNWQDNDWYDLALRKYTPQVKYALDMSGGTEKTNYFLSLAHFNQGSNYTTNVANFKRYNVRANVTQKFERQGLTAGLNLYGTFTNSKYPSSSAFAIWSHLQNSPPWKLAYNPDGTYAAGVDHPLVDIDPRSGYARNEVRNMNANFNLDWEVPWVKGLKAGVLAYAKTEDGFNKYWNTRAPQYDNLGIEQARSLPSLSQDMFRFNSYTLQSRIDYSRTFGAHTVSALALYEETENKSEGFSASRRDYVSSSVDQLFAGSSDGVNNSGSASESGRRGYVGRLKYDYLAKYILEGSFRYDGSDNFPKDSRWGFFPALSAGWVISEEKFFEFMKRRKVLDFLKIRYSYAQVGNDAVARFPYLSNYSLNQNVYVVNGNLMNGFSEGPLVDPTAVTWYETSDYNTGVDFSTLNSKLTGSIDYFYKRTTNFLTNPAARYTTPLGASLPVVRSNSAFRRAGWEFQLGYNNKAGAFTYSVSGNATLYDELWERNANEDSVALKNPLTRVTHETDYWGTAYINQGFYQSVDEIINNPRRISAGQLVPGDLRYKDVNGDGKIDGSDFVRTGRSAFPHLVYGMNLSVGYKSVSVEMLWQGTGTRSTYLGGTLQAPTAAQIVYDFQRDFWTPENREARYPRQTNINAANSNNNYTTSDFWLYNAKYLRLKSLRVAFDVKKQFPRQFGFLNSCLVTVNGTNLLTFSEVKDYFDPETGNESNYGYPTQKVFSFGLNIGF